MKLSLHTQLNIVTVGWRLCRQCRHSGPGPDPRTAKNMVVKNVLVSGTAHSRQPTVTVSTNLAGMSLRRHVFFSRPVMRTFICNHVPYLDKINILYTKSPNCRLTESNNVGMVISLQIAACVYYELWTVFKL